jgi:hypothetical protein
VYDERHDAGFGERYEEIHDASPGARREPPAAIPDTTSCQIVDSRFRISRAGGWN